MNDVNDRIAYSKKRRSDMHAACKKIVRCDGTTRPLQGHDDIKDVVLVLLL